MTGRDGGLSGETEALCVLGIGDYALIIVYIGEGGIVYINPGSPRRAHKTGTGIVYLVARFRPLAPEVGRQILAAEEERRDALRCGRNIEGILDSESRFDKGDKLYSALIHAAFLLYPGDIGINLLYILRAARFRGHDEIGFKGNNGFEVIAPILRIY